MIGSRQSAPALRLAAILVLAMLVAASVYGCSSGSQGATESTTTEATDAPAPAGAVPSAEAQALFAKVGAAMQSADIPPADVDTYATVLSALEARRAAAKASTPTTGPSEAAIASAVKLWSTQFKFADNESVARAVEDVTTKLTESAELSDAEAIVWVTERDVTDVLGELGTANEIVPEADGWVKVTLPSGADDGGPRTVRVKLAKDKDAWRIVGMDFGGAFAGARAPSATN